MRYKKLAEGTQRAFLGFGEWGIGVTIAESSKGAMAMIDIGIDNDMRTFRKSCFQSVPEAKLWAVRMIRDIAGSIMEWADA